MLGMADGEHSGHAGRELGHVDGAGFRLLGWGQLVVQDASPDEVAAGGDQSVEQPQILGVLDTPLQHGFAANVVGEGLGLFQQQHVPPGAR